MQPLRQVLRVMTMMMLMSHRLPLQTMTIGSPWSRATLPLPLRHHPQRHPRHHHSPSSRRSQHRLWPAQATWYHQHQTGHDLGTWLQLHPRLRRAASGDPALGMATTSQPASMHRRALQLRLALPQLWMRKKHRHSSRRRRRRRRTLRRTSTWTQSGYVAPW